MKLNLERGFRRLTLVLSIGVMILGITVDATIMSPFPTGKVRITLADDRQVILDDMPDLGPYRNRKDTKRLALAVAISRLPEFSRPTATMRIIRLADGAQFEGPWTKVPDGFALLAVQPDDIKDVTLARVGLARWLSWSWANAGFSLLSVGLVVVLWIAFFAIKWVARGFAAP